MNDNFIIYNPVSDMYIKYNMDKKM